MVAVDFFCGAGGVTRGLLDAGVKVALGIDIDPGCRDTYSRNNVAPDFLPADLRELQPSEISEWLPSEAADNLLFTASPPCQPFTKQSTSPSNKKTRTLLLELLRFIEAFAPGQVIVENVPGITKCPGFSTYRRTVKRLRELGYHLTEGILDAKDYGIPQTRRRYLMLAMRGCTPSLPAQTHGPELHPYRTVRDAIAHFPPICAGETHPRIPNHRASRLSPRNLKRIRCTPHDGGDRRDWSKDIVLSCHRGAYNGHTDVYGRMWWNRPAPALTCRCDSLSSGRYGHPTQDRAISLREAAALQTFPDSYTFHGASKAHVASQIGNAVPVALARSLGRHVLRLRNG